MSVKLENFRLYVTNSTENVTSIDEPVFDYVGSVYGDGLFNISFNESMYARYVYITLPSRGAVSLCEVRVFGGMVIPK